jgi:hypothetical protein
VAAYLAAEIRCAAVRAMRGTGPADSYLCPDCGTHQFLMPSEITLAFWHRSVWHKAGVASVATSICASTWLTITSSERMHNRGTVALSAIVMSGIFAMSFVTNRKFFRFFRVRCLNTCLSCSQRCLDGLICFARRGKIASWEPKE